jgi:hypothetical protein
MERLGDITPRQKAKTVGLGFFGDLFCSGKWVMPRFGPWMRVNWRDQFNLIVARIRLCPQHQFVTLTKFPENIPTDFDWPDNWSIGVSCTTQAEVEERVPALLDSGVPHPILSLEPLLGQAEIRQYLPQENPQPHDYESQAEFLCRVEQEDNGKLKWVIVGGLTGYGESPTQIKWIEDIVIQCEQAGVPLFVKPNAPQPNDDGSADSWLPWPKQAPAPIAAILRANGIEAEDT